ncbi:MAG: RusA family crossover junction endodeoxyribonuclease [Bacteroidales bacterium]
MSDIIIYRVVLGEPTPQARHRHFRRGELTGSYDPSKKGKNTFASILHDDAPKELLDCPMLLELNFYMARPKGHYGTGKNSGKLKDSAPEWHTGRPDLDNLQKFVQDALNGVYYRDDATICQVIARKLYSEKPRTEITIHSLL